VIWNGRDPAAFCSAPKRQIAFAAGRLWDEAKNIGTLCKAADDLAWPVLVAGDATSPDGDIMETPPNVVCLGKLPADEVAVRMAESAVFVSPARYEPFGLAVLEAAMSNCALVLGDIPTLRELWDGAALFVQPNDEAGLRDALEGLLADPARAAGLGARARRRAQRYTAVRTADAYLDAYRALISAGAGRFRETALRPSA
jgi:glycosyltransferase involved in cell wall biosynthesis